MKTDYYKKTLHSAPFAYAYHQIILDEGGISADYSFLEANAAFEKMTGYNFMGKSLWKVVNPPSNSLAHPCSDGIRFRLIHQKKTVFPLFLLILPTKKNPSWKTFLMSILTSSLLQTWTAIFSKSTKNGKMCWAIKNLKSKMLIRSTGKSSGR